LKAPGNLTLIGSAAFALARMIATSARNCPEPAWDVDPVKDVAMRCYEALIGSEFERIHGWHVNLMPESVLKELPAGWQSRASAKQIGKLNLQVPAPADLLAPKLKRNEPRDRAHAEWAKRELKTNNVHAYFIVSPVGWFRMGRRRLGRLDPANSNCSAFGAVDTGLRRPTPAGSDRRWAGSPG